MHLYSLCLCIYKYILVKNTYTEKISYLDCEHHLILNYET